MAPTGRGRTGLALTLAVSGGVVFSVPVRRNQNDDGDREGAEQALAAAVLAAAGPLFAHGSKPDWPKMRQRREASVCPSTGAAAFVRISHSSQQPEERRGTMASGDESPLNTH